MSSHERRAQARPIDLGAGLLEQVDGGRRVVADADLLEDVDGLLMDKLSLRLGEVRHAGSRHRASLGSFAGGLGGRPPWTGGVRPHSIL